MGFPSQDQVLQAAKRLTFKEDGSFIRTNGLWHVLMFLRHAACHGHHQQYMFESHDLAQAAFDLNGVLLPISEDTRNCYFEPGATGGTEVLKFFRHRDGPRQTYLNRIYTGLVGGARRPKLFDASSDSLPTTVHLVADWLKVLRDTADNKFILDACTHELVTWIFRFGVPSQAGATAHLAAPLGNGKMKLDPATNRSQLPSSQGQIESELCKYFALPPAQIKALFPQLQRLRPAEWAHIAPLSPQDFGAHLLSFFETGTANPGGTPDLSQLVTEAHTAFVDDAALRVEREFLGRFVAALLAKRFVILTGLSGSGKTKLAQAFAHWITPDPDWAEPTNHAKGKKPNPHYALVPVGADWTGNENIIGYPDGLRPPTATEKGCYVTKPSLDLLLHASNPANAQIPHFLILDEMNLSHVERYFADLLSIIESKESMTLYSDENGADGQPKNTRGLDPVLRLPPNLFIIGTVNVDETTYMFSPKVLDRANVIEFRVTQEEMNDFLTSPKFLDLEQIDGAGEPFAKDFVKAAADKQATVPADVKDRFQAEMRLFFALQRAHGAEFGYRVAHEIARFLHFYRALSAGKPWRSAPPAPTRPNPELALAAPPSRDWFDYAFDAAVIQKFLPKLHGSKVKLAPLLKKLYTAAIEAPIPSPRDPQALAAALNDPEASVALKEPKRETPQAARYPITAEKLFRMWRHLNENGFTSFPEN